MEINSYNFAFASEIIKDLAAQQERIILEQLDGLVEKGLLVIEQAQPVLIKNSHSNKIEVSQKIRLALRDKEYIERLEKENAELKRRLEMIERAFHNCI